MTHTFARDYEILECQLCSRRLERQWMTYWRGKTVCPYCKSRKAAEARAKAAKKENK